MAYYKYDKKVLKGLGIKKFLNEVKERESHIASAKAEDVKAEFNANKIAARLHPHFQVLKIVEVKDYGFGKEYTFKANKECGTNELATFRAGQFLSIVIEMPDRTTCRTYSIISSPNEALGEDGFYKIYIGDVPNAFTVPFIYENWKVGDTIVASAPLGEFYYNPIRDSKNVIALAGGITPFLSMAKAIRDGNDDYNLIILYNAFIESALVYKNELDELQKETNGKVKVHYILVKDENPNYEHGMINKEILEKYIDGKDCSMFINAPAAMGYIYDAAASLNLSKRRTNIMPVGQYGDPVKSKKYPTEKKDKEFEITVLVHGEEYKIKCNYNETLMDACQKLKLHVTTDCRSGICGWCHSRLISGDVFVPEEQDGRREADKKFGWVHPCITYPLSDVTIEVFPNY